LKALNQKDEFGFYVMEKGSLMFSKQWQKKVVRISEGIHPIN